ncbi:MAG: hypothetical protein PHT94_02110 [Candidatus Nanoarchaeia archaeon]|nr:hypothetical protein [Candidatus Nanoarchaeia archaeon]
MIRKMNKKAIELSINFIVIMVISLIVFVLAIGILGMIRNSANDQILMSESQFKAEIEKMLTDTDDSFAIPFAVVELKSNKAYVLETGIKNKIVDNLYFNISVELFKAIDFNGDTITDNPEITYGKDLVHLDKNEIVQRKIMFSKMTQKGSYIYQLNLSNSNDGSNFNHQESHLFTITVN